MKNKNIVSMLMIVLMIVMVAASPALARGNGGKCGNCCMMMGKMLDLTVEQQNKIQKLKLEPQKVMIPVKAELQKQKLEFKTLMMNPTDRKKIDAKIDEISKTRAEIQKKCVSHRLAVRNLLTDEQKTKFNNMMFQRGCSKKKSHHHRHAQEIKCLSKE
jgi:Spy/CpxP family protein refolding chaperone